jgi:hypothetical protein
MIELERRLQLMWERLNERVDSGPVEIDALVRRVRRRRTLFATAVAASVAVVVVAVGALAGSIRDPFGVPPAAHPSSSGPCGAEAGCPRPGWVTHRDTRDGLSISTPSSWTYRQDNISGPSSPAPEFAVGTWNFPAGGNCAPTKALHSVPPGGAFFYMFEQQQGSANDFPARPSHFRLGRMEGPFECLGVRAYHLAFRQSGRFFTIFVELGRIATTWEQRQHQVERSLNSLTVEPAPKAPGCVLARTSGDFDGDGTKDVALLETLAQRCADKVAKPPTIHIEFGDGTSWQRQFKQCQGGSCNAVFAATDLDGDGRSELAAEVGPGSALDFVELFRVARHGLQPLTIAPPGRPQLGISPGPAIFGGGFDSGAQNPIRCLVSPSGMRWLIAIDAELRGDGWHVHRTQLRLIRDVLHVVGSTTRTTSSFPIGGIRFNACNQQTSGF